MNPTEKAPTVLPSEQVGPKGWIRVIMCLELADNYDADQISSILTTAWANFKERTPMVGVEMVPLGPEVKPAGMVKLQPYSEGDIVDFVVKDHRKNDALPSFAQLKAQNFPTAAFDVDTFCYRGLGGEWPNYAVDRVPTNMMQANLIKGGLLLNHLCFHGFADATTMWKLTELFAEDVRRAQGLDIEKPAIIHMQDRAKLLESTGKHVSANFAENHKEFLHIPFTPEAIPPGLTDIPHHANIFQFTPDAIRALKEECSPSNVRLPDYITTNDALTALLWRSTQRAEQHDHSAVGDKPSVIQVALDTRRRAHVPVHPHTLGNIMGYTVAALPLQQVLSGEHASLADLAVLVRQGVAKSGHTYYDELANYVENMDNVNRLVITAFLDMIGANVLQSNWSEFDYYRIEWGPAFGHRIKAFRFPASGVCPGFNIIMPSPPSAPKDTRELLINVSDKAWPRLMADETWNRYATNPTTVVY
jgi:hypothetical protein